MSPWTRQRRPDPRRAFSIVEVAVSLGIIVVLLALLIPAMGSARSAARLEQCAANLATLGEAWAVTVEANDQRFPFVGFRPGWQYGGVRFSEVTGRPVLDYQRPLNLYFAGAGPDGLACFCCPADAGITDRLPSVGTGSRTAFRSFGTSYRANASLLDARVARVSSEPRGLALNEITVAPSRCVIAGDPIWYEVYQDTGRRADWHGRSDSGNLLFLDGSVRFQQIRPLTRNQPVRFDPIVSRGDTR